MVKKRCIRDNGRAAPRAGPAVCIQRDEIAPREYVSRIPRRVKRRENKIRGGKKKVKNPIPIIVIRGLMTRDRCVVAVVFAGAVRAGSAAKNYSIQYIREIAVV